jgi:hypothetical protein
MLTVYTRHSQKCPHRDDIAWRRCRCPKWIQGTASEDHEFDWLDKNPALKMKKAEEKCSGRLFHRRRISAHSERDLRLCRLARRPRLSLSPGTNACADFLDALVRACDPRCRIARERQAKRPESGSGLCPIHGALETLSARSSSNYYTTCLLTSNSLSGIPRTHAPG